MDRHLRSQTRDFADGRRGRFLPLLVAAVLLGLLVPPRLAGDEEPRGREAPLLEAMALALGGREAWNGTRFLRWQMVREEGGRLVAERRHLWDKWTGRYRLEAEGDEGHTWVASLDLDTHQGTAWVDGAPVTGAQARPWLERAWAYWARDSYWLLMPYKLRDPGVVVRWEGEVRSGDGAWDRLAVRFTTRGADRYWLYVNQRTRLLDRCDVERAGEKRPPTSYEWRQWRRVGRIMLSAERADDRRGVRIRFPVLEAPQRVPDEAFSRPP